MIFSCLAAISITKYHSNIPHSSLCKKLMVTAYTLSSNKLAKCLSDVFDSKCLVA